MKNLIRMFIIIFLCTACRYGVDQEYIQAAQIAITNYELALDSLDIRLEILEDDPQMIDDHVWRVESLRILDDLQATVNSIRDLPEPPTDWSELDRLLNLAAEAAAPYAAAMTAAINERNFEGIDKAGAYREVIDQSMEEVQNELSKLLPST